MSVSLRRIVLADRTRHLGIVHAVPVAEAFEHHSDRAKNTRIVRIGTAARCILSI